MIESRHDTRRHVPLGIWGRRKRGEGLASPLAAGWQRQPCGPPDDNHDNLGDFGFTVSASVWEGPKIQEWPELLKEGVNNAI